MKKQQYKKRSRILTSSTKYRMIVSNSISFSFAKKNVCRLLQYILKLQCHETHFRYIIYKNTLLTYIKKNCTWMK